MLARQRRYGQNRTSAPATQALFSGQSPAPTATTLAAGPSISAPSSSARIRARGKFLWAGEDKIYLRGVTYGPFTPDRNGISYPSRPVVERDFGAMSAAGINSIRTYDTPPPWLLDIANSHGLRVMVGLQVEQLAGFLDDRRIASEIRARVRSKVRACAAHPAAMSYVIANEIPASIVRWHGARRVEQFLQMLYAIAKDEHPEGLFCYANYPTTEYLDLSFLDLACFNVYLESQLQFEAYLSRLQILAGDRPLLMTELGLDSLGNGTARQAEVLGWQIPVAFQTGCAGAYVFAWTDEWYSRGREVDDWNFGLTDRGRAPKPALAAVSRAFDETPFPPATRWPRISVVVSTYNGRRTIGDCLDGLQKLTYPDYEVIVVDDGSTDGVADIIGRYPVRIIRTENRGLSAARNTGMEAASGEIVAYIDDDASPDPEWLHHIAIAFLKRDCAAVGGPNVPFPHDGSVAACVAKAPGGPTPVLLSDTEAEHIAGCNMAFRKSSLQAIGGFDPQFRVAGDDVDVCWRLRDRGGKLAFSPSAIVWHHYRNSLRGYWKQQAGYGKAEALLERKFPEKFNCAGHITWGGRIYSAGLLPLLMRGQSRIYQGTWGSAAYARLYEGPAGPFKSLLLMPESALVVLGFLMLAAAGRLWRPLLMAGAAPLVCISVMLGASLSRAFRLRFANQPENRRVLLRLQLLTALLHPFHLLARMAGRLRFGLTLWRTRSSASVSFPRRRILWLASDNWHDVIERLQSLETALRAGGAMVRRGGPFDRWDLEGRTGMLGKVRLLMAEEHSGGRQLVRVRVWPKTSAPALVLALLLVALAVAAALDGATAAAFVLGAPAVGLGVLLARDCMTAAAAVHQALSAMGFRKGNG